MQKIYWIHEFILKILGSHKLEVIFDHAHLKVTESTFSFPEFVPVCKQSVYSISSFLRYSHF